MTNSNSPGTPAPEPSAEDQRHELQGILGEYHGLLTTIVQELPGMVPDTELAYLIGDIGNAFPGVSIAFGKVQGELNAGGHDERLDGVALSSEQLQPKKRGFRFNYRRFYDAMSNRGDRSQSPPRPFNLVRTLKYAMRGVKWGNVIIGSLSIELSKFKGIEIIKEFGEVVVTTLEQIIDKESEDAGES